MQAGQDQGNLGDRNMKKLLLLCFLSACTGAWVTLMINSRVGDTTASAQAQTAAQWANHVAQQPLSVSGAATPTYSTARAPAAVSTNSLDQVFSEDEQVNISVYENVNRSVVNITTRTLGRETMFFIERPSEGTGSGSVIDKRGHILTNYHVIEDSDVIQVTLHDGTSYDAELVGQDPSNDIAVLRIAAPESSLIPVPLGDSSGIKVGQKIFAIGNPFGLERTLTVGIVSSLNRTLPSRNGRTMKSIIQIDAALNQGNSGGPLLNSRSQLVGMNTAIASHVGQNSGVGFAIPVNTINRVVTQLIQFGHVRRADIGILKTWDAPNGLGIAVVAEDGPADRAGLQGIRERVIETRRGPYIYRTSRLDFEASDRIIEIDGVPVTSLDDILTVVEGKKPGQQVEVTAIRQDRTVKVRVTLGLEE